jgi:hypothetical protein
VAENLLKGKHRVREKNFEDAIIAFEQAVNTEEKWYTMNRGIGF